MDIEAKPPYSVAALRSPPRRWLEQKGITMRTAILALALLGALVLLHAADRFGPVPEPPRPASYPAADPDPAHRDLEAIVESGELRILVPTGAGGRLITPAEESLFERFARARNLEPVWLGLPWNELYDALRDGEGDV